MKNSSSIDQVMEVISDIQIIDHFRFKFRHKLYSYSRQSIYHEWSQDANHFGSNQDLDQKYSVDFGSFLADTIYNNFYSSHRPLDESANPEIIPGYLERQNAFIEKLSAANTSSITMDPFWTVTGFQGEKAIIQKNEFSKFLVPNTFVLVNPKEGLKIGSRLHLRERVEDHTIQPIFFYIFGNATEQDINEILRFYFNIKSDGAPLLITAITETFNRYHIPFNFKCLNEPNWYTRTDNSVLYVDKRFRNILQEVIQEIYLRIFDWLNETTPPFTLTLARGLGFAEDPGYGRSFGMERCKIIANIILRAHQDETKLNKKRVKQAFLDRGLHPNQLHLRPFSSTEYNFQINHS